MADKVGIRSATIVLKDDRVLLVKSQYDESMFYLFPGGGMEFGETIEECAIRETAEETGVAVKIKGLFHVNEYIYRDDWNKRSVSFFFIAEQTGVASPKTDDDGKIKKVEWVSIENLSKYDVRPRIVAKMLQNPKLDNGLYSVDFKEQVSRKA